MFYFMLVLTLASSLLFYGLYPRSDAIKVVDVPEAKPLVGSLLAWHNAARSAATVVKTDANGNNSFAYANWEKNKNLTQDQISAFLPSGYTPNSAIHAKIFCIRNDNGGLTIDCSTPFGDSVYNKGTSDFLVSYIKADDVDREHDRTLGEMTFLTNYSNDEHLNVNCGYVQSCTRANTDDFTNKIIKFDEDRNCIAEKSVYSINNTRYNTINLPGALTTGNAPTLEEGDLVCITRLWQSYNNTGNIIRIEE